MRHFQIWVLTTLAGALVACGGNPSSSEFDLIGAAGGDGAGGWANGGEVPDDSFCRPGIAVVCTCSNGAQSTARCHLDGSGYETCPCDSWGGWGPSPLPPADEQVCTPGEERACICENGAIGTGGCLSDGSAWKPCECLELPAGSADIDGGSVGSPADFGEASPGDVDPLLIDDLEDGNAKIPEVEGRRGIWYTINDETPGGIQFPALDEFSPATDGAAGSNCSARTWGEGFFDWGIALGVNFNFGGGYPEILPRAYDATAYGGVGFYLKGVGTVRVNFSTMAVVPPSDGGSCSATCWDKHGVDFELTDTWTYHEIRWDDPDLGQQGWGTPAPFDPSQLLSMEFQMLWAAEYSDVYVDELRFLERE
jgi:hypothetical protein